MWIAAGQCLEQTAPPSELVENGVRNLQGLVCAAGPSAFGYALMLERPSGSLVLKRMLVPRISARASLSLQKAPMTFNLEQSD